MSEIEKVTINRDMSLRAKFHRMPPMRHDRDPHASTVLAHIREVLGCEMDRAVKAFNSMRNKRSQVLVFDNVEKTWTGCFWTPSEEEERERKSRRELMALERSVAALKSDMRKLRKEFRKVMRALGKSKPEEQEGDTSQDPDAPSAYPVSVNPGIQSREFRRILDIADENELAEKAAIEAGLPIPPKQPWQRRTWMGCCDGCGSSALAGLEGAWTCRSCGLDYQAKSC